MKEYFICFIYIRNSTNTKSNLTDRVYTQVIFGDIPWPYERKKSQEFPRVGKM